MAAVFTIYEDFESVHEAVEDLDDNGYDAEDMSIVASDVDGHYTRFLEEEAVEDITEDVDAGEGAAFGALVGVLSGLAVAFAPLAIPGIGAVVAAGPLVSALTGGAVGAAAGAPTGGLIAALVDMGLDEDEAREYEQAISEGNILLAVEVDEDEMDEALNIMRRHSAARV